MLKTRIIMEMNIANRRLTFIYFKSIVNFNENYFPIMGKVNKLTRSDVAIHLTLP